MTDATAVEPASVNLPATADPNAAPEGLEDIDESDLVMPMLRIVHDEAVFEDTLSGKKYDKVEGILLGLIKQRVLWDSEVKTESRPLCKSYDFSIGHPDTKEFPWKASGFELPTDLEASVTLPCENCKLQEWGSHPTRDAPWCSAQHTFAMLMPAGEDDYAPALFTVQRSAIKPSKTYLTSFMRNKKPLYTVFTKLSLDARKRGAVDFAVPKFIEGEATDSEKWPEYTQHYRRIRDFIQTPRGKEDDDAVASGTPATSTAADPVVTDDDLPF